MSKKFFNLLVAWTTLLSLIFPTAETAVAAAPVEPSVSSTSSAGLESGINADLLPGWMSDRPSGVESNDSATLLGNDLIPGWISDEPLFEEYDEELGLGGGLLPVWLDSGDSQGSDSFKKIVLSPGPGVCPVAANVSMRLSAPSYSVSRGNEAGDVYTVTITNNSSTEIPEVSLLVDPNKGFYYLGATATATSSISGTILITDPGTTAPDAAFSLILNVTPRPPEKQLMPGETITFTFRLATNAEALSGQQLFASLVSGDTPPATCQTAVVNVPTVRGNLTVEKSPTTQDGRFGDIILWNIRLKNTGLGIVYQAVFTDTAGSGYTGVLVDPIPAPVDLAPNATQTYTVSAQINSCTNLTNTVAASWSIGNSDGTATPTNPLSDDVDILFVLDEPDVIVEVAPIPEQDYCGVYTATIPVTVTNQGGAARNMYLSASVQGGLILDTNDPDWSRSGDIFTYLGGSPEGTLAPGEVITFTLEISSDRLCETVNARVDFTPHFMDACLCLDYTGGTNGVSQTLAVEAPTLELTKTGPNVINAGDVFTYVVNVSGNNQQSIAAPGVLITDSIPSELIIQQVTASRGVFTQTGYLVGWNIPITTAVGSYHETLYIRVEVPAIGLGECGAGGDITNRSGASARGCPDCWLLESNAEVTTHVQDFLGGNNHFERFVPSIELCALGDEQTIENYVDINDGITWTGTIFTDTLGLGVFGHPLEIVPGSVSVLIDTLDRTADVTIMPGPPLRIDFSAIGVYSDTADITITYQVTAAFGTLPFEMGSQTFFQFASIHLGGYPSSSCGGQDVGYFGSYLTLNQGIMDFAVTPGDILGCHENTVRLDVTGPNTVTLTDHLVVNFTADPGDVFTATQYELGGSFIDTTVDVVQVGNVATFTFPTNFNFNENGWILFPLFRPCGVEAPLLADIQYQDRCAAVRTASGTGGSTTLISNVTLFTTPDQYTVNTKDAVWRFYVGNGSTVAAENVIVTNTLPAGHKFIDAVISSTSAPTDTVSFITGTLPGGQEVVTFTISSLPQFGRLRFDISSRIDDLCDLPADIGIALFDDCGRVGPGEVCQGRQESKVTLLPGPTFLVSSNDQTARLPLCEIGFARLIVKNSSAAAEEFDFHVTNTLTNATLIPGSVLVTVTNELGQIVVGNTSGQLLAGIPFPPVVVTNGNAQILTWSRSDFSSGTAAFDVLDVRQASDVIEILFEVQTGCAGTEAQVQSVGTARDVCQRPLSFTEDAKTLLVNAPELSVIKRGFNVSRGYALVDLVYARPGDVVRWQIDVTNIGDQHVLNLFVTDTLPINYSYSGSNQGGVFDGTDMVSWTLTGDPVLDVGATSTFLITGTILANSCALDTHNDVYAIFACSTGDLCSGLPAEAEATLQSRPSVASLASYGELTNCGGEITINITNDGPPADNVVLTDTLPTGFVFEQLISATTMPDGTPIDGVNPAVFRWSGTNLLPGGTTTLVFRVRNSVLAGSCSVPPVPITNRLQLEYNDACDAGPYFITQTDSDSFELDNPVLIVNQNPIAQVRDVGDLAVWTLTVQNTGDAPAVNVSIQDHVASNFNSIVASNGSYGTIANIVGNDITWTPAITIPASGMWTAILTATILSNGVNTNILTATATCGSGCQYASASRTAYVTLLEEFTKTPTWQYGTIGDLQVYQFSAVLPDQDAVYADLILSDTLPAGLGFLSSAVTYTENADATPVVHHMDTPTSAPAFAQSGTIRWELGDLDGVVQISGVVTAVIQDVASNVHRTILPNRIRLTYMDDGQPYTFYSTGNTVVQEPLLQVNKRYLTENGCGNLLFQDNFNDGNSSGWTVAGTVYQYTYRAATGSAIRSLGGPADLADISYSAMVSSTDTAGDWGLIFRYQDTNNYYRYRFNRTASGAGSQILERVANGTPTVLASAGAAGYSLRRWYHLEVTAAAGLYRVYVDGNLVLSANEAAPAWTSGRIGFYTNNQQYAYFDDVFVTSYHQDGCEVGYGDLITYTLSISNQWPVDAHDLRLVDSLPDGTSLVTYNVQSDDPLTTITLQPAPIPGATGDLPWEFNQLAARVPFAANDHTSLTVTVVISVSPGISASTILPNQVVLSYDSQANGGPVDIQRSYSGGSHSNAVQTVTPAIRKSSAPPEETIGALFTYTITVPAQPITATLYNVTITDQIAANLMLVTSTVQINGGVGGLDQSSGNHLQVHFESLPAMTQANILFTAVVRNISENQEGVTISNTSLLNWDAQLPIVSNQVENALVEPTLVISKSVSPENSKPGDMVFYTLRLYHEAGDTETAYNVVMTDVVPAELDYIPGTLSLYSGPIGTLNDGGAPTLLAEFPVVDPTWTAARPIRLTYAAVVRRSVSAGIFITNTVNSTWTSLPDDPYGERRDGTGGVNDYHIQDQAQVALPEIRIEKTGPLTITAGEVILYQVTVTNEGPSALNAVITDTMPFQVNTIAATPSQGGCVILPAVSGDVIVCDLGMMNPGQATIAISGLVDPNTPPAADLTNRVLVSSTSPDGVTSNNTAEVDTEVFTRGDLELSKTGPLAAIAGEIITYTITVSNSGPSTSQDVDVKDLLPEGVTYLSASASQGLCVSGICQLGDLPVGGEVSVVVTALVGSSITGVITNTAEVFADTLDDNPTNNLDTHPTTVSGWTRLEISKVDLTDPVYAGETYFYEIVITNTGPSDAENLVISDTLPVYVLFEGASPECSHDGSPLGGRVTCTRDRLAAGESLDYLINVRVNPTTADGTVGTNSVTASTTTPIDPGSVLRDDETTRYLQKVGNPTDLAIIKTSAPASGLAGSGQFTYTLTVVNNGPSPATAVQVVDAYPREFDFFSASTSDGSLCNQGMTCDLGEMAVGETVVITLVVGIPADAPAGAYVNYAHVGSASPDSNPANNDDDATNTVVELANLEISKQASPDPAIAGQDLTYLMDVSNTGPSLARNVIVSDTIPLGFQPVTFITTKGVCTIAAGVFTCNLGDLLPGEQAQVILVGAVLAGASATQIANTVEVSSTTPGIGDTATVTPGLAGQVDLWLVKTGTATANPGDVVSYNITIRNQGPSDASNVTMADQLPAGLTFSSVSPDVGCTQSGGLITCDLGTLSAFAQRVYVIQATVDADVAPGTSLENSAVATSGSPDINLLNNSDNADTTILGEADLTVLKSQLNPNPITSGELVTYTIVITNAGPGLARDVDVKDQLPSGFTLDSIQTEDGVCGGTVCEYGAILPGETRMVTLTARVDPTVAAGNYLNTAGVFSVDESNPENNESSVTTMVTTSADLSVHKVDLNDPVAPAEGFMYQINVYNQGPSAAQNVVVTDTLDSNTIFEGASPECFLVGNQVVCELVSLAAQTSASFMIAVTAGDVPSGTVLENRVVVRSVTPDPNPENNADDAYTTVQQNFGPEVDLAIQKIGTPAIVIAGEIVTYTLVMTNAGPLAATNVTVLDLIPAGTSAITISTQNPDDLSEHCSLGGVCHLGTVYSSTTAMVQLVLRVNQDYEGDLLYNTASVSGDQKDPNPANNLDDESTIVTHSADLMVLKSDLADPVVAGEFLLYQIIVTNIGPSLAQNVVITDALPSGAMFVGASPLCSQAAGIVICALGELAANASSSVWVQVQTSNTLPDPTVITNTARVESLTPDPDLSNNQDAEETTIHQSGFNPTDLAIEKLDLPDPVVAGEILTYTMVVTNIGPAPAINVMVVDALPAGVEYLVALPSQGLCSAGVTCALGDLNVGAIAIIRVVVRVHSAQTGSLTNFAQVSSANPDIDPSNNQDSQTTNIITRADLLLWKDGPATAIPGHSLSYQIYVENLGPSDARNVVVSDTIPTVLSAAIASASQGSCTVAGGLLTCNLGDLVAYASAEVSLQATLDPSANRPFTNTAQVSSSTPEDHPENNRDDATTAPTPAADLELTKLATPTAVAGGQITYQLSIYNHGVSTARTITATDTLPTEVTFVSASAGCSHSAGVVTCMAESLDQGSSIQFSIIVAVAPDLTPGVSLENTAIVTAATPDDNPINNQDNADTSIIAQADLGIEKRTVTDPVIAGETVTYTIVVTNYGPSLAQEVEVWDFLPSGTTLVSIAPERGSCVQTICVLGNMAVGEIITIQVVARLDPTLVAGSQIRNSARVLSLTPDPGPHPNLDDAINLAVRLADIYVQKSHTGVIQPGQPFVYTLLIGNFGPSIATGVILTDTLPLGLVIISSASGCGLIQSNPDVVRCILPDLNAGAQTSFSLHVLPDANLLPGVLTNTVDVSTLTPETNLVNNHAEDPASISPLADLRLVKSDQPDPVTAGEILTYTLTATNLGPSLAQTATVTDTLPPQVQYLSANVSCALLSTGPDVIACDLGNIRSGASVSFHVRVRVRADTLPGASLVNEATIVSLTLDPNPGNNDADAITAVIASADLEVDKTCPVGTLVGGEIITYTVVITNYGPSTSQDVDLKDFLPDGMLPVSAQTSTGEPCLDDLCQFGDMQPGEVITVYVTAQVGEDVLPGVVLENLAQVYSDTPDPDPADNSDSCSNPAGALAKLRIEKRDLVDPVGQGGLIIYEVSVFNDGPSNARDVIVSDTLPSQVSYLGNSDHCIEGPAGRLTCSLNQVEAGENRSFLVTVQVAADVFSGTILTNQVALTTSTPLSPDSALTDTEETLVIEQPTPPADLAIQKIASPTVVVAGSDTVTFSLQISNLGPATATGVEVVDALPDGLTLVNATPSQGSCWDALQCSIGVLAVGRTATVQIVALVDGDVISGTLITNTAVVRGNQPDPNPNNNIDDDTIVVRTLADLAVTKLDDPDPVISGEELRYRLVIENLGPSDAHQVTVSDTLPAELIFVSADPIPVSGPNPLIWSLGTLPAGMTTTVEVRVEVDPAALDTFTNTVRVDGGDPDPNPNNNHDEEPTNVTPQADLSIIKTGDPHAVIAGDTLTYTLYVHNAGPSVAQLVQVTDYLPGEVEFVQSIPAQTSGPDPLVWDLGGMLINESRVITLVVSVNEWVVDNFTNTATVEALTPDPNPDNNVDNEVTEVNDLADLSVVKQAFPQIVNPEDPLQYLITVHNVGPSPAQEVVVTDFLPPEVSLVSSTPTASSGPDPWRWNLGTLLSGETRAITLTVFVEPWAMGVFTNTVAVASSTPDPNPDNNYDETPVIVGIPTDVQLDYFNLTLQEMNVIRLDWAMVVDPIEMVYKIYKAPVENFSAAEMLGTRISSPGGTATYSISDSVPSPGVWWYWLVVENSLGISTIFPPIKLNYTIQYLPVIRKE